MESSRTNAEYKRNDRYNVLYEIEWILSVLWIFFVWQTRQIRQIDTIYGNQALRIVCGFFNVPLLFYNKSCETGPPAYSPYHSSGMLCVYMKTIISIQLKGHSSHFLHCVQHKITKRKLNHRKVLFLSGFFVAASVAAPSSRHYA